MYNHFKPISSTFCSYFFNIFKTPCRVTQQSLIPRAYVLIFNILGLSIVDKSSISSSRSFKKALCLCLYGNDFAFVALCHERNLYWFVLIIFYIIIFPIVQTKSVVEQHHRLGETLRKSCQIWIYELQNYLFNVVHVNVPQIWLKYSAVYSFLLSEPSLKYLIVYFVKCH